jgi:hypothetical protein
MASLALKAVHLGADKIPDKAFHALPGGYFRPPGEKNPLKLKKKKNKKKNKNEDKQRQEGDDRSRGSQQPSRENSDDDEDSKNSGYSESDEEKEIETRPKRREKRYPRSSDLDRGYDSDQGMTHDRYEASARRAPPPANYFPPPPTRAVDDEELHQPEPYNPAEYGESTSRRDRYYTKHPEEQQPYNAAAYQQPVSYSPKVKLD